MDKLWASPQNMTEIQNLHTDTWTLTMCLPSRRKTAIWDRQKPISQQRNSTGRSLCWLKNRNPVGCNLRIRPVGQGIACNFSVYDPQIYESWSSEEKVVREMPEFLGPSTGYCLQWVGFLTSRIILPWNCHNPQFKSRGGGYCHIWAI